MVYVKSRRRKEVSFRIDSVVRYDLIESIFAHDGWMFPSSSRLIKLLLLDQMDHDLGNTAVIHTFGHERLKFDCSSSGYINTVLVPASYLL